MTWLNLDTGVSRMNTNLRCWRKNSSTQMQRKKPWLIEGCEPRYFDTGIQCSTAWAGTENKSVKNCCLASTCHSKLLTAVKLNHVNCQTIFHASLSGPIDFWLSFNSWTFLNGPFPVSFSLFLSFLLNNWWIKFCRWRGSNHRSLVLEATALPIEPQPLGNCFWTLCCHLETSGQRSL